MEAVPAVPTLVSKPTAEDVKMVLPAVAHATQVAAEPLGPS